MTALQTTSDAFEVTAARGGCPIVLVCEHASNHVPGDLKDLGVGPDVLKSHVAWDPGALGVARVMADRLGASLVASRISRLVYDCNRPPDAPDAIPERSEIHEVPGNRSLTAAERNIRVARVYEPFHAALAAELAGHTAPVMVTIHSFTPVYDGQVRDVEIGILHDADARLADAILDVADHHRPQRNAPYGPEHGVTHTLKRHALAVGALNVMVEIRNDLIDGAAAQRRMAEMLCDWLSRALATLGVTACKA
ncbi:MAG: N-formylglutamate amidohydrolase [Pseudomonadota bacterium]